MNGVHLSEQFPAGCYIGFNAMFDRKAAEQLMLVCGQAMQNGYNEINLCLSSLGGLFDDVFYIVNMLEALPVKIVSHNVGTIQSAANLVFLCGDERCAVPGSTFFFHQTHFSPPPGQNVNKAFMTQRLKAIEDNDDRCAAFYRDKTGQEPHEISEWCDAEFLMTADLALQSGIIGTIKQLAIPPNSFFHQVVV